MEGKTSEDKATTTYRSTTLTKKLAIIPTIKVDSNDMNKFEKAEMLKNGSN